MTTLTLRQTNSRTLASVIIFSAWVAAPHAGFAAKIGETTVKTEDVSKTETVAPRSSFDYRGGKDPFFPNRQVTSEAMPQPPTPAEVMVLRGVSGSSDRRVALINNRTFTKGEVGELESGTNKFKIRVIEIKEKSVIIEREGQAGSTKLPLRDNVLPITKEK
ncbi:MAG TPA: hypothetical protein VJW76_06570 [Verrucomicrobiae bacterium]|nr:hypothetical protein [Verrucomicrobiae bacterium]